MLKKVTIPGYIKLAFGVLYILIGIMEEEAIMAITGGVLILHAD